MNIPQEILTQLGGRRFIVMTGAKCYSEGENTLIVKFKGSKKSNLLKVKLNVMDTYEMEFQKYRADKVNTIASFENVYCDMLRPIFEQTTGLATQL